MSRSTHGNDITVTCEDWQPSEQVVCRTIFTKGDVEWINRSAIKSGSNEEGKLEIGIQLDADSVCTVAAMVRSWTLTEDATDKFGNPLCNADGTILQRPRRLGDTLNERLEAVRKLHNDDVDLIWNKIKEAQVSFQKAEDARKKAQQQPEETIEVFTKDASALSSTN